MKADIVDTTNVKGSDKYILIVGEEDTNTSTNFTFTRQELYLLHVKMRELFKEEE